jgi:hypothetical protein
MLKRHTYYNERQREEEAVEVGLEEVVVGTIKEVQSAEVRGGTGASVILFDEEFPTTVGPVGCVTWVRGLSWVVASLRNKGRRITSSFHLLGNK